MMNNIEVLFVKERMLDILSLQHKVEEYERLVDAEKTKTETASSLVAKANSEKDAIQKKLTAMCCCVNGLAIADWSKVSPNKCKRFIIDMKKDIELCIKEHGIHFNSEGRAE